MDASFHTLRAVSGAALFAAYACAQNSTEPERGLAPVDGGQIEYVITGPQGGESVLLIHGAMLGSAFGPIQAEPALGDYRVIRMHLRGFEGSSDTDPSMTSADDARDAAALLDTLGIARAHVVGHSAGGAVAMWLAVDAPHKVRTLVLVDPAPPSEVAPPELTGQNGTAPPTGADIEPGDVEAELAAFAAFVFGDDWREYFDATPRGYEQAIADARRQAVGAPPRAPDAPPIAALEQPVLVLWGDASMLATPSSLLAAAIPDAAGRAIAGTDHALIVQKPREVAMTIAEFITRHPM